MKVKQRTTFLLGNETLFDLLSEAESELLTQEDWFKGFSEQHQKMITEAFKALRYELYDWADTSSEALIGVLAMMVYRREEELDAMARDPFGGD